MSETTSTLGTAWIAQEHLKDPLLKTHPSFVHLREQLGLDAISLLEDNCALVDLTHTRHALSKHFNDRIAHNHQCLEQAGINVHDPAHMHRVGHGAYKLAERLKMDRNHMKVMYLATCFHDVGHTFPGDPELLPLKGSDQNKKDQADHPMIGADLFLEALQDCKTHGDSGIGNHATEAELSDWDDYCDQIAHRSIRHHSNGSDYNPTEVPDIAKLPRLVDACDNTYKRVYPSHLARLQSQAPLQPGRVALGQCREAFEKVDDQYQHRLIPAVILDQYLQFSPHDMEVIAHYAVDLGQIADRTNTRYTVEGFLNDFDQTYGQTSMPRAADVMHEIRSKRIPGSLPSSSIPSFGVMFHFHGGETVLKEYSADQALQS